MNKFSLFISENFLAVILLLSLISILIIYERRKGGKKVDTSEMTRLINKENPFVFDLRSAAEFSAGSVAGASNIQPSSLVKGDALFKANENDCIVLICKTGTTSSKSARLSLARGDNIESILALERSLSRSNIFNS